MVSLIARCCLRRCYIVSKWTLTTSALRWPGWYASTMRRHHSPGWCCNGPSVLTRCIGQSRFSPECVRCAESIDHPLFHWSVVHALCNLIDIYMVCILDGQFLLQECANITEKNMSSMCYCAYLTLYEAWIGWRNRSFIEARSSLPKWSFSFFILFSIFQGKIYRNSLKDGKGLALG